MKDDDFVYVVMEGNLPIGVYFSMKGAKIEYPRNEVCIVKYNSDKQVVDARSRRACEWACNPASETYRCS